MSILINKSCVVFSKPPCLPKLPIVSEKTSSPAIANPDMYAILSQSVG